MHWTACEVAYEGDGQGPSDNVHSGRVGIEFTLYYLIAMLFSQIHSSDIQQIALVEQVKIIKKILL